MTPKQSVSPFATGGAGTLYEYRVAAILLSHLLAGSHPPGLLRPVVEIGFQQRARGHLFDDIVVYGEPAPGGMCTEFQVKRTLDVAAGNAQFADVVMQALHRLAEVPSSGEVELGLIAERNEKSPDQLAALTESARAHGSSRGSFDDLFVADVVKVGLRNRLTQVQKAVAAAITNGAPDLGGTKATTHQLLSNLHVWRASADGADFRMALDRLSETAESFDVDPIDVFGHLTAAAQASGPHGGVVDAEWVRRQLRRRLRKREASSVAPEHPHLMDVDAIVRGPLRSLDLEEQITEAERLLAAEDAEAAARFAAVADRLEAGNFIPHAMAIRRREARALHASGHADDAMLLKVELAWRNLDGVRPWEAGFALHDGQMPGHQRELSESTQRVRRAASAAVTVAKGTSIERMLPAFDALSVDDPLVVRAATFLCEEAIADDRPALILDRIDRIATIIDAIASSLDKTTRRCSLRTQMCVADATGMWASLLQRGLFREERPVVAWLHARYARYLALEGDGEKSHYHYQQAIERASDMGMFDEAADWLYALRTVRLWYDIFWEDEQHPLAQALRPHAKPSTLPGAPFTSTLALRSNVWTWCSPDGTPLAPPTAGYCPPHDDGARCAAPTPG
jgi:hypothetical protein